MSIFSPCSSVITLRTRLPMGPMQAPLAFTPRLVRADRDLRAVPGLARDGVDVHRARGDLRHLQCEQLLHQVRVGPRQGDRRSPVALAHVQHVAAQPLAMGVALPGHLFRRGQDGLDLAQVHEHRPRVLALLDDTRHDVAFPAGVLAEGELVLGVTQPLQDHLARGGRGDPAEAIGGVVVLAARRPVLGGLAGPDGDVATAAVDLHPGGGRGARGGLVGDAAAHPRWP